MEGGFDDSPIRLNEFLRRTFNWTEETINERAKELSSKAVQIWKFPQISDLDLEKYKPEEKEVATYSIEDYEYLNGPVLELYQILKKRILNIDSSVKEEIKKYYIAFKSSTNFADIVPQKSRLRISLNIDFSEIIDPKGICKDVSGLGRWGNGDVEVAISDVSQLDDIMELIQQAFDKQIEFL